MVHVSYLTFQWTVAFRAAMGVCCHTQGNLEDTLRRFSTSKSPQPGTFNITEGPVLTNQYSVSVIQAQS